MVRTIGNYWCVTLIDPSGFVNPPRLIENEPSSCIEPTRLIENEPSGLGDPSNSVDNPGLVDKPGFVNPSRLIDCQPPGFVNPSGSIQPLRLVDPSRAILRTHQLLRRRRASLVLHASGHVVAIQLSRGIQRLSACAGVDVVVPPLAVGTVIGVVHGYACFVGRERIRVGRRRVDRTATHEHVIYRRTIHVCAVVIIHLIRGRFAPDLSLPQHDSLHLVGRAIGPAGVTVVTDVGVAVVAQATAPDPIVAMDVNVFAVVVACEFERIGYHGRVDHHSLNAMRNFDDAVCHRATVNVGTIASMRCVAYGMVLVNHGI